jgi:organic hydroperoxide reductase OsmC/OhrA
MAASNKPHAKNTNGMPHESLTPIPQERLTFHPHAQRNGFGRRGARLQSRLFARWNQSLRRSPNSNRLCWRAPTERYNIRRILPDVSMHRYEAKIKWGRNGAKFTDNRYSRAHEWSFDGGVKVCASASPAVVPPPFSVTEAIDPEEALVAAASSCHMLAFLFLAARHGFVVESYEDNAFGVMEKNERGMFAISRITLRPRIEFSAQRPPSPAELEGLHNEAHTTATSPTPSSARWWWRRRL